MDIQLTFSLEAFALDNEARRLTQATQRHYRYSLSLFERWCAGQGIDTLEAINATVMRRFLVSLQRRELSSNYTHNLCRAIRRWLAFCADEGYMDAAPKVTMPRLDRHLLPALTGDELKRVLAACDTPRDKAFLLFLVDSGLRCAEACSLNLGDVDLPSGTVSLPIGKGGKGRIVYVGVAARKAIMLYLAKRGERNPDAPLFVAERGGGRLTTNAVIQLMRRLQARSGVAHVSAHALRRTFAINSLRNGMDIHSLRLLMGHSDIDVLRRYLDLSEYDLAAAHKAASPADKILR